MQKHVKTVMYIVLIFLLPLLQSPVYCLDAETDPTHKASPEEFFVPKYDQFKIENLALLGTASFTVSYNEYDQLMQDKEDARRVLLKRNASSVEIAAAKEVLDLDPAETIYNLQEKSDTELKTRGLNEEDIARIRNFGGSDAELRAIAATCTVGGTPKYTRNSSGRWAKITMYFSWNRVPFWNSRDAVVAGANNSFLAQRVADSSCTINYTAYGTNGSSDYTIYYDSNNMVINPFSGGLVQAFSFPFAQDKFSYITWNDISYYAASGTATMVFKSVDDKQVSISYGHAHAKKNITASLGVSFSSSGASAGLSFGLTDDAYSVVRKACDPYSFSY